MTVSSATLIEELRGKIKGIVKANEPMSRHTSYCIGGPADLYAEPADIEDIVTLLVESNRLGIPWYPIGDGQNLLVSDHGIRGMVIRLGKPLGYIKVDGVRVIAGAGAKLTKTMDVAMRHSLAGLEGCTGVPGSIGGAIVMNAGTKYGYVGDVTRRVRVVNSDGSVQDLTPEEVGFTYRGSGLQSGGRIVVEAEFELKPGSKEDLISMVDRLKRRRNMTQPSATKSAGCVFKNPDDLHASRMIDGAGAKGMRIGGAEVSTKHANYLINTGNACASDVRALAERTREMVHDKFGIMLDYEVKLLGDWQDVD
ncbi:MAG: UDP-N-acetylmuramate dehydrogenase [Armatimonadota bacterium]|nr:UDP-N-acetylmuramate dehydrogenase [Armatimonadota bacterium]